MKRDNCVLVIAGPSGAGKTVVATSIVNEHPEFTFLRSGTTRPKRGDAHDDEYIYYTEEEFKAAVENGEMAEHAIYGGAMYGTPNAELDRAFVEGKTPILVIDLNGVKSLALHPKYSACNLYIYTDIDVIEQRLRDRYFVENFKPDSEINFQKRTAQNLQDWHDIPDFGEYIHAFIENNVSVEECCSKVLATFSEYVKGADKDEWLNKAIINGLVNVSNNRRD